MPHVTPWVHALGRKKPAPCRTGAWRASSHDRRIYSGARDTIDCPPSIQLMEAEAALYWRTVCKHLQSEAHAKGSDAAATMGTEAEVYAAEASDRNDLLEKILPATVNEYIELVRAHINAGSNHRFATRQLLLLGAMFDFSDATNRKAAGAFLHELMCKCPEHEEDDEGNIVVLGDGLSFGGDNDWAEAVASFASKVHAAAGEFEEVVLAIIEELAQPCKERTANHVQWMHSLSLTGLLLKNAKSLRILQGKAITPDELLQTLLLPGVSIAANCLTRANSALSDTCLRSLTANCLSAWEMKCAGQTSSLGRAKDCSQMPWSLWPSGKETKCRTFETVEDFIY
ncbi:condensin complex subunit 3 [Vigna unguiculata]|uniref:Condensin complex subunit 3 n=1 Tax=Vigna unguiculata TaxID=3917 RepID=A0A4D6MAN0_VIGUN|nr:condensin complex subunit 3 [Vigna unguiculata]